MQLQLPFLHHKTGRAILLTAVLIICLSTVVKLLPVPLNNELVFGFTFDFLLTVPLFYLLLIRKTAVPAITAVPLSIGMLLLAGWLLPQHQQHYLDLYKQFALPVLELTAVAVIVYKIRKAGKALKEAGAQTDMFYRLQLAAREVVPVPERVHSILATEVGMFYYAVAAFRKSRLQSGFSYHRETAMMAVMGAFMLLVMVETIAVHLLLMQWSVLAANILTFLSLYSLITLLAIAGAAKHRPHELTSEGLLLRFGLQETLIPYEQVEGLESLKGDVPEEKALVKLGLLANFNLILRVQEPQLLKSLYGIRRNYKTVVFWADDPKAFQEAYLVKRAGVQ